MLAVAAVSGLAACSGGSSAPTSGSTTPLAAAGSTRGTPAPAATCPLTGTPPARGQDPRRPALAVKVDNVDQARPQAGLESADLVIEETVEGGLTRLVAVFQCNTASSIGPVRSARLSDVDLLRMLRHPVFAFSGANYRSLQAVRTRSGAALVPFDSSPQFYHRDPSRPAPHDVFSSTSTVLRAAAAAHRGLPAPPPVFAYGQLTQPGQRVRTAAVTWPAASASWRWDGHRWVRTQNGTPDRVVAGIQVSAANVVALQIAVHATGLHDVLGSASPEDVTTGKGKAWVLRDGRLVHATWSRAKATDGFTFRDKAGHPVLLAPGPTWIELLPTPAQPHFS